MTNTVISTEIDTGPGTDTLGNTAHADLLVGGMTCASRVARVEKKLNRLDGVSATVSLATASASVDYDPAATDEDLLVATIEKTGHTAAVAALDPTQDADSDEATWPGPSATTSSGSRSPPRGCSTR